MKKIKLPKLTKEQKKNLVHVGMILHLIYFHTLCINYVYSIYRLQPVILLNNGVYIILTIFMPPLLWVYSTNFGFYNFHRRKLYLIYTMIISSVLTALQPIYTLLWKLIVPLVLKIEISRTVSVAMVINLARMLLVLTFGIILLIIFTEIKPFFFSKEAKEQLAAFKLKHVVDIRENKKNLYDLHIVKDIKTGAYKVIKEADRLVHCFIDGASGTGKTSSTYIPAIANDLTTKINNMVKRYILLFKMIRDDEAYFTHRFIKFKESYIKPKEGFEEKYNKIYKTYKDAGVTVQAPNGAMNKDIIRLAAAKGNQMVNVLDPTITIPFSRNMRLVGMNPFWLPVKYKNKPNELTEEITVKILEQSKVFAEVMTSLNEISGKVDPYFSGINKAVTNNVAIVHMLDCYLQGKQADIFMIQKSINNYSRLQEPIDRIETALGFNITVDVNKRPQGGGSISPERAQQKKAKERMVEDYTSSAMAERKIQEELEDSEFYIPLYTVKQELLGEGKEELFKQARGLRNLINDFLNDPRTRRVFKRKEILDFDEMLSQSQITTVNTAVKYGQATSTALGLFFMLNLNNAVFRRPEEDRSMHMLYIDEGPQYLHPVIDTMWTLWRQYNVAICFDAQSLSQFRHYPTTAYLEDVIMSAGFHIVFGRLAPQDIDIYNKLAGKERVIEKQTTESSTSMLSEEPHRVMADRYAETERDKKDGSSLREKDFQEVTVFAIDEGRVLGAEDGKVDFIEAKEFKKMKIKMIQFKKVFSAWEQRCKQDGIDLSFLELAPELEDENIKDENTKTVEESVAAAAEPIKKQKQKESKKTDNKMPIPVQVKKEPEKGQTEKIPAAKTSSTEKKEEKKESVPVAKRKPTENKPVRAPQSAQKPVPKIKGEVLATIKEEEFKIENTDDFKDFDDFFSSKSL